MNKCSFSKFCEFLFRIYIGVGRQRQRRRQVYSVGDKNICRRQKHLSAANFFVGDKYKSWRQNLKWVKTCCLMYTNDIYVINIVKFGHWYAVYLTHCNFKQVKKSQNKSTKSKLVKLWSKWFFFAILHLW